MKGITDSGFEFEVEEAALDDWDFVEALAELEEKPQNIVKAAKILLGKDQVNRLREHNRKGERVSLTGMSNDIMSIMNNIKKGKN